MKSKNNKITPETLYLMSKKGSMEKIEYLEYLLTLLPDSYEINRDYYKKFRDTLFRCLKNNSIQELHKEVYKIKVRNDVQFNSFINLAHNIMKLFDQVQFLYSGKVLCKKVLNEEFIVSAPSHLSLQIGNENWIVWFYFCLPELSQERIQFQLQLMRYLSGGVGIPTIIDVQRGKIYQAEVNSILNFIVRQEIDFIDGYLKNQSFAA